MGVVIGSGAGGGGLSRELASAGIDEFTDLRWITVQQAPRHYPF